MNREYSEMWMGDWWWFMQVCDGQLFEMGTNS